MKKKSELKYYKYQMNPLLMNLYAIILFVIVIVIVLNTYKIDTFKFGAFELIFMVMWFILHELLHYVGFLTSKKVTTKDLMLGMYFEKGIFYCMCKKAISKKDIMVSLMFPLFFIGIVTLALGYIFNSFLLVLLSVVNISGAVGDILMFIQISLMPKDVKYTDIDDPTSYYILSDKDISSIKVPALKLVETGTYNEKDFVPKDKRKIVITKLSYVFLILVIVVFILSIIFKL